MYKEAIEFMKENGGKAFVADLAKTVGLILGILDHEAVLNWIRGMALELWQNEALREEWEKSKRFLRQAYRLFFVGTIPRVLIWLTLIAATAILPESDMSAMVIIFCLCVSFLVGVVQALFALKGHVVVEIALGAGGLLMEAADMASGILPSPIRPRLPRHDKLVEAARGVYRIPYKALFYEGVIDIALALIACLSFRSYYGAILAAAVPSFFLLGLGLKVGYDLKSDSARIWAFRFVAIAMVSGLVILAAVSLVGPKNVTAWRNSKSVATMKADAVYNRRTAEIREANDLYPKIMKAEREGNADPKTLATMHETYKWLLRDGVNKGPRPVIAPDPIPTCSDGKDNNKNGVKDTEDPSCYRPVISSDCVKIVDRKTVSEPDCRNQFVGVNGGQPIMTTLPDGKKVKQWYKYDTSLDEKDLPKAVATNASTNAPALPTPPRASSGRPQPPRPSSDDRLRRAAAETLRELGL